MKKTTVLLFALILSFVFSNLLYAESNEMSRNDSCFVTAQAETKVIYAETANKPEANAPGVKTEKRGTDVYVIEGGEWDWDETIHDH